MLWASRCKEFFKEAWHCIAIDRDWLKHSIGDAGNMAFLKIVGGLGLDL